MRAGLARLLAVVLLLTAAPLSAFIVYPLSEEQLVVEVDTIGDTVEDAVAEARREAALGAVGRVLMTDNLIMADDILRKYVANYAVNYVDAVEVLDSEFVQGRNEVRSRVFLDYNSMISDLEDKRFFYEPAFRPRFATFMAERLDGRVVDEGAAREALAIALNNLGLRRYGNELATPPAATDVSDDDFLLNTAIVSAQRSGVEVIVTGEVTTTLTDQQKLYFDDYWFYTSEMSARIIRVDTGDVLFTAEASGTASDEDAAIAIEQSINNAAQRVAEQLVPPFEDYWSTVVQREADYEVLLTGIQPDLASIVADYIAGLGMNTRVHIRKTFDRSTSLSIESDAPRDALLERIRSSTYPTLKVLNPEAERTFEVQVTT